MYIEDIFIYLMSTIA